MGLDMVTFLRDETLSSGGQAHHDNGDSSVLGLNALVSRDEGVPERHRGLQCFSKYGC